MTATQFKKASFMSEFHPPKPHWKAENMPDLTGKVAFVTGGNTGIGFETVTALLKKNAKVYLAARNESKAKAAIAKALELTKAPASNLIYHHLDFGNLAKTKQSAEAFIATGEKIDQLYCNAGVMTPPNGSETEDGIELQFGTNVVAHHLLIKILVPALEKAVQQSTTEGDVRVCITASVAHHICPGGFDPKNPEREGVTSFRKGFVASWNSYGLSKRSNILDAKAWARRLGDKGIIVTSCHPGNLRTELSRHQTGFRGVFYRTVFDKLMLYDSWLGAITQLYANTAPEAKELHGKYLVPWARVGKPAPDTEIESNQEVLFEHCEKLIKSKI